MRLHSRSDRIREQSKSRLYKLDSYFYTHDSKPFKFIDLRMLKNNNNNNRSSNSSSNAAAKGSNGDVKKCGKAVNKFFTPCRYV